jgi:hypothetical protein
LREDEFWITRRTVKVPQPRAIIADANKAATLQMGRVMRSLYLALPAWFQGSFVQPATGGTGAEYGRIMDALVSSIPGDGPVVYFVLDGIKYDKSMHSKSFHAVCLHLFGDRLSRVQGLAPEQAAFVWKCMSRAWRGASIHIADFVFKVLGTMFSGEAWTWVFNTIVHLSILGYARTMYPSLVAMVTSDDSVIAVRTHHREVVAQVLRTAYFRAGVAVDGYITHDYTRTEFASMVPIRFSVNGVVQYVWINKPGRLFGRGFYCIVPSLLGVKPNGVVTPWLADAYVKATMRSINYSDVIPFTRCVRAAAELIGGDPPKRIVEAVARHDTPSVDQVVCVTETWEDFSQRYNVSVVELKRREADLAAQLARHGLHCYTDTAFLTDVDLHGDVPDAIPFSLCPDEVIWGPVVEEAIKRIPLAIGVPGGLVGAAFGLYESWHFGITGRQMLGRVFVHAALGALPFSDAIIAHSFINISILLARKA